MSAERVKGIFFRVMEAVREEREAVLERECAGDAALAARVRELVRAHDSAGAFLEAPTVSAGPGDGEASSSGSVAPEPTPREIGGRRIIRRLGEGGFGVVYLAEEEGPVRRRVAVKVVRPGMGSREVVARFEAERQALALMAHPCISQVYDAGTTPEGLPYFVMEYVEGEPITSYCQSRGPGVRARVELMERVCLAVEHAHQKGVIHRDIKPSNVLVSEVDGAPTPKVIDFGIVKAVRGSLGEVDVVTMTAQIVGTPQYMSPEQASFGEIDVDTRSDVYSLGALLHEVLTGEPVFDRERVKGVGARELERMIREEVPPRASSRVMGAGGAGSEERTRLWRALRGDLDWIIARAMEKERYRRYPTASALAQDLRRYLDGEAVLAGPPSGLYRARKFVARHRIEVAAASAVVLTLVALVVVAVTTASEAERARREAERELEKYEAIARFTEGIISGIDPTVARGKDTALLETVLRDASERLDEEPPGEAEVEIRLRTMIGSAQSSVADFEHAEHQLRAAAALARSSLGERDALTMEVESVLGEMLGRMGRFEEALELFASVHERRTEAFGPEDARTIEALSNAGVAMHQLGRWEEALAAHERVLAVRTRELGEDHELTVATLNNMATDLGELGRSEESIEMFRRVIEHQRRTLGDDHARTLMTRNNLATGLQELGRNEEAVEILRDVLRVKRRILEPHHPSVLVTMNNLASSLGKVGAHEEALELQREAVALAEESTGPTSPYTLTIRHNMVKNLMRAGRLEEALRDQRVVLARFSESHGETDPRSITARDQLADILRRLGRLDEALELTSWGMEVGVAALPEDHRVIAKLEESHGLVLTALGRYAEARAVLASAYGRFVRAVGEDDPRAHRCAAAMVECLEGLGESEEAARWAALARGSALDPGP